jgi:hypothetical protein
MMIALLIISLYNHSFRSCSTVNIAAPNNDRIVESMKHGLCFGVSIRVILSDGDRDVTVITQYADTNTLDGNYS